MAGLMIAIFCAQPATAASPGCNSIAGGALSAGSGFHGSGTTFTLYQGEAIRFDNVYGFSPLQAWIDSTSTTIAQGGNGTMIVQASGNQYVGWGRTDATSIITVTCTAPTAPTISSVSPANGPATGGTALTITGADFFGVTALRLGGHLVSFTVVDSGTITLTTVQATPGTVDIQIDAMAGSVQRPAAFTYDIVATTIGIDASNFDPATGTLGVSAYASAASGTPAGTITMSVDGAVSSAAVLDASGRADLNVSGLAPGSRNIRIDYSGGGAFGPSQTMFAQPVPQRAPTVVLASSPNPSTFGAPATLTATVTAAVDTPTGTITFNDGGQVLGTVGLGGGTASLVVGSFSTGSHNLTATYNGDSNLQVSTALLAHVVGPADTTTLISSSTNPSTAGQDVTFTAQVQAAAGNPTGTVKFLIDGAELGTAVLANGVAIYATNQLGAGAHNVVARYEGSTDYAASDSAPLTQNVAALASLVIRQTTSGADGAFGFAIMPSATTLVVTTMAGQGQSAPLTVPAGNYTIVADDMRGAGFGLTSLTCSDPDAAIELATRTARITLMPGEAVVCSFSAVDSVGVTSALIKDFMETRASLLLENLPDSSRRVGRLKGSIPGNSSPGSLLGYLPDIGSTLPVSASLAALDALAGNRKPSRFDAWIEGSFAVFDTNAAGGRLSTLALGADYLITDDLLLGGFIQLDGLRQSADIGEAKIAGDGWLAGPYATLRLTDTLFLDLMAAMGGSTNRVSPFGTYTDEFTAERYLLQATLEGSWTSGDWTFSPRASISYFEETSESYADNLGVMIPSVTAGVGKITLGPGVQYKFSAGDGVSATAGVRLDGMIDFGNAGIAKPHAAINASLDFAADTGTRLGFDLGYGGLGSDTSSLNGKFRLGISMQ